MISAKNYSIIVRHGIFEEEECFEAKVLEFPDLVEYADTYEEAYELMLDGIETTQEIFSEKNREFPLPSNILDNEYSGRVTLRMPKGLHKAMAVTADQDGTSLNQYLVSLLSYSQGYATSLSQLKDTIEETIQSSLEEVKERGISINIHYKAIDEEIVSTYPNNYGISDQNDFCLTAS